jgi:hypothetical protein
MSLRESIADDIVSTLQSASSPLEIKYVTREPFDYAKLSNAQYPACLVQSSIEDREDITLGGNSNRRSGIIEYTITGFVKSTSIDTARNNLIETIEDALDADRTRGGYALDSQVIRVETDEGSIDPIGGVIVTVRVRYNYVRGTS